MPYKQKVNISLTCVNRRSCCGHFTKTLTLKDETRMAEMVTNFLFYTEYAPWEKTRFFVKAHLFLVPVRQLSFPHPHFYLLSQPPHPSCSVSPEWLCKRISSKYRESSLTITTGIESRDVSAVENPHRENIAAEQSWRKATRLTNTIDLEDLITILVYERTQGQIATCRPIIWENMWNTHLLYAVQYTEIESLQHNNHF